jgi:hypothetical protein
MAKKYNIRLKSMVLAVARILCYAFATLRLLKYLPVLKQPFRCFQTGSGGKRKEEAYEKTDLCLSGTRHAAVPGCSGLRGG